MERQKVSSSNINSVGYDPTSQILEIEFNYGGIYQYLNVPQLVFDNLMSAGSIGGYHAQYIKNDYPFNKL